jgi:hypothetical protein
LHKADTRYCSCVEMYSGREGRWIDVKIKFVEWMRLSLDMGFRPYWLSAFMLQFEPRRVSTFTQSRHVRTNTAVSPRYWSRIPRLLHQPAIPTPKDIFQGHSSFVLSTLRKLVPVPNLTVNPTTSFLVPKKYFPPSTLQ